MTDEFSWIWLTLEKMGFPLRSEFANENHGEAGSSKQCNDQRTDQTAFFLAPIITDFIWNTKRELYDEKLEDALEMLDLEWSKDDDTKTQCNRLNTSPLHRGNASNKCSEDCFYYCSERNNVVVLFWTLKVQSFILTEVSDCGLLIVVTSSTFLKRKDMLKEKSS